MPTGRIIAIGDIHGCDVALESILNLIDPQPSDCLVCLGDVIDRGPASRRCVELLLDLRQHCRLIHLMGNHEEMMLEAMHGGRWTSTWPAYGGREMLASYGGSFWNIPPAHLDFLRTGKDYFETERDIFVHGWVRPEVPVEFEVAEQLRWARFQISDRPHCSGKRVICGHTAQRSGRPIGNRFYLCLDTAVYVPQGCLTALDVSAEMAWQASQSGARHGPRPLHEILAG